MDPFTALTITAPFFRVTKCMDFLCKHRPCPTFLSVAAALRTIVCLGQSSGVSLLLAGCPFCPNEHHSTEKMAPFCIPHLSQHPHILCLKCPSLCPSRCLYKRRCREFGEEWGEAQGCHLVEMCAQSLLVPPSCLLVLKAWGVGMGRLIFSSFSSLPL